MPYKSKRKQRAAMKRWRKRNPGYMTAYGRDYYARFGKRKAA